MNKVYTRINWENYPSTKTELDAGNLNTIDYAVNEMDNRIIEQDTSKANKTELSNLIKDWNMDESTGIITITKYNGSTIMFDLNIEKIPVSFSLSDDGILTMETDDGTKFTANIEAMIPILTFNESDDIAVSVEGTGINKTYTFSLKNGAVTEEKLHPNYLANIKVEVANANAYSQAASNAATTSQSWAVGGTDSRENEDSNNAKYWAEQARTASGVGIASTSTAGKVLATSDVKVDSTGAMSIGTEFTVPEGLTNLVSGSDWNVILGQLAKLVGDYMDTISTLDSNMWLQLTTQPESNYTSILAIVKAVPNDKNRVYSIKSTFTDYPPIMTAMGYTVYPVIKITSKGSVRYIELIACDANGRTKIIKGYTTIESSTIVWQEEDNICNALHLQATNSADSLSVFTAKVPDKYKNVSSLMYAISQIIGNWGTWSVCNTDVSNGVIKIATNYTGSDVFSPWFSILLFY